MGEHQLGDFIKGRLLFVEDYCKNKGLDYPKTLAAIEAEALKLAGTDERREFLRNRLFTGSILSSSVLPDWLDKVFLESMTHVLKGPGAAVYSRSSRIPCIPFDAGRFNAHRQSESVFRLLYERKAPEDWLKQTFPVLYKKCYGEEAARKLTVEPVSPQHFRIGMDNRALEKASPADCSTTIGYLFGSMEKLGAKEIVVNHTQCGAGQGERGSLCIYEITWK